jgi:Zn-dependent peptidase ImmA (M78 family)
VFERGFKTWCEKYSADMRKDLGLPSDSPLDTLMLAKKLGVRVWTPQDVKGLDASDLKVLLRNDGKTPTCWSAVTVVVGTKVVVVLNTSHSRARQASDLTHELSHRVLGHEAEEVDVTATGLMLLRSYDKKQEEEADWLSGCLLLPREALTTIKREQLEHVEAASRYGVSVRMLTYRLAMTGVNRQFARA